MKRSPIVLFFLVSPILLSACDSDVVNKASCGDGFIDPGEECDGEILPFQNCEQLGYYSQTGALRCNSNCTLDVSVCASRCGDTVIQYQYEEDCEGADLGGQNCASIGQGNGTLGCLATCRFDVSGCEGTSSCGDGAVSSPTEQCEADDLQGQTCLTLGYYGGELACDSDCRFATGSCETFGSCGDHQVQDLYGEECEGADLAGETCLSRGFHGGVLSCDSDCRFVLDDCEAAGRCGDDLTQPAHEECDGTDLDGQTCLTLGQHGGVLACSVACEFDLSGCQRCGDGITQPPAETCDGDDLDGMTCEALGYHPGLLGCSVDCGGFVTDGCGGRCGDGVLQPAYEACELGELDGATCGTLGAGLGLPDCSGGCELETAPCRPVTAIFRGAYHYCALVDDATVRCWGQNGFGQLGDGSTTNRSASVAVTGLTGAVQGAGGMSNHACAVIPGGELRCWGLNNQGQLGDGSLVNRTAPVPVAGLAGVVEAGTGGAFTCARRTGGQVSCWGRNNAGQLGNSTTTNSLTPVTVSGLTAVSLHVGYEHACAVLAGGTAVCWGANTFGRLGDGTTNDRMVPTPVSGLTGVTAMSAGTWHTCALVAGGTLKCWGRNESGQLGDGTVTDRPSPVDVVALTGVTTLGCGQAHTCALVADGSAYCWGSNTAGQLGNGSTTLSSMPVAVGGLLGAIGIGPGADHTCARLTGGTIHCWGGNTGGQLGDGTTIQRTTPVVAY